MHNFEENLKQLSLKLFEIGALKFGNFTMKVGINSPVYFDLRVIVSHPEVLEQLSSLLWQFAEQRGIKPKVLCGVPYTALPITTVISVKTRIPMLIRRKEPKNYGTKKLIEGKFTPGDECLIVEDVVTSGVSILETLHDLKNDDLYVKDTLVVIDREQGGQKNLVDNGIAMHSLLTLSNVMNILYEAGKVDSSTVERVKIYLSENQIFPDGRPMSKTLFESRLTMSFASRAEKAENPLTKKLFHLMERKKSNLCIAVDVSTSSDLLFIIEKVGKEAVVIKTHYDAISDWNDATEKSLLDLAKTLDFLILEDRKFADIGNTVFLQCDAVFSWAEMVTLHTITGSEAVEAAKKAALKHGSRGIFLVAEMSCKGSLISPQYMKTTGDLALSNCDSIIGLVCQNPNLFSYPGFIQLTPGVSTSSGEDSLGQQYVGPEEAVLIKGGDLIVIGRAIVKSEDPSKSAAYLRERLWEAYKKRISSSLI